MKLHLRAADYRFPTPLTEGVILKRPNRFIMQVRVNGEVVNAHCPNTGKIGSIVFKDIPVLMSYHDGPHRKMKWTVEAISYNRPEDPDKTWIGVNTGASNRYVEHFLKHGMFNNMVEVRVPTQVKRERKLGDARIDFKIGDTFLEVKTWTQVIEKAVPDWLEQRPFKEHEFSGGERLIKHAKALTEALQSHQRCIMLSCYQYVPDEDKRDPDYSLLYSDTKPISEAFDAAHRAGVESWDCYLEIHPDRVKLVSYEQTDIH